MDIRAYVDTPLLQFDDCHTVVPFSVFPRTRLEEPLGHLRSFPGAKLLQSFPNIFRFHPTPSSGVSTRTAGRWLSPQRGPMPTATRTGRRVNPFMHASSIGLLGPGPPQREPYLGLLFSKKAVTPSRASFVSPHNT